MKSLGGCFANEAAKSERILLALREPPCPADAPPTAEWSMDVGPGMRLSAWHIERDFHDLRPSTRLPILSLRLILSGEITCRVDGRTQARLVGPRLCIAARVEDTFSIDLLGEAQPLRVLGIDFLTGAFPDVCPFGLEGFAQALNCPLSGVGPALLHQPAGAPLTSLGAQIMSCPVRGAARDVYLCGLTLQFLALAMDCVAPSMDALSGTRVSLEDIERIDFVKCLIRERLHEPPPLEDLAGRLGINVKRLSHTFRRVCGMGIPDYLQACRFQHAFFLVTHSRLRISEIAYAIGYTPAHFSTAFKQRYGYHPSALRDTKTPT